MHRADHRQTYDALFDLWWPAALGGRTVLEAETAGPAEALDPQDAEAMREMLLDLLANNPDIGDLDDRLVAMIAALGLITYWPDLTLWLPRAMGVMGE